MNVEKRVTDAAAQYFRTATRTQLLLNLFVDSMYYGDFVAHTAAKALARIDNIETGGDDSVFRREPDDRARSGDVVGPRVKAFKRNLQDFLQMFVQRFVDNFETYLVSIIREVLRKKPHVLSNSEFRLAIKNILEHESVDSLVHELVEREISSLSYSGFEPLQSWCQKRGIALTVPTGQLQTIIELIATRNLIAHNRGVVDHKYLAIVKTSPFKAGELRALKSVDLSNAIDVLGQVVEATDQVVAHDFALSVVPLESAS